MSDFPKTVEALLVAEYGRTEAEAAALVTKHTDIIIHGIMAGLTFLSVRATATALVMRDEEVVADTPIEVRP